MALLQVKSALKRYLPGIAHMQSDAWIREVRTKGTFIQLVVLYTVSSIIFSNLFQP
jgi:hypothetical protein